MSADITIDVRERELRLSRPLGTAHGEISARRLITVEVRRGHATGVGEAAPLPGFGLESYETARSALTRWNPSGPLPVEPCAAGAAATALAQLAAAEAGRTLSEHLGAASPDAPIDVQALVGAEQPGDAAAAAAAAATQGYRAIKLKVGVGKLDVDRIIAVREAAPGAKIRLDANQGWDRTTALHVLESTTGLGIDLVEEPTADPADLEWLWNQTGAALAIDEHAADADAIRRLIGAPYLAAVVLKPAVLGGPAATIELANEALAAGHRVIVSSFIDAAPGLRAAAAVARVVAPHEIHGLGTGDMFTVALPDDVRPSGGRISAE